MTAMTEQQSPGQHWQLFRYCRLILFCLAGILLLNPDSATAQELVFPEKPPTEHWFVDEAGLIGAEEQGQIDETALTLWQDEEIPVYIVTIRSIAGYNPSGEPVSIEVYANELFNAWGIGSQERNYGMLLLVSLGDRKARIQLGASWDFEYNVQAQRIMNTLIIPHFKKDDYSLGILDGVRGLDALARGLGLPKPTRPWWILPLFLVGIALVIGVIVSLFKSGRKGWGWAVIIGLGFLIVILLKIAAASGGSGGGFGGGSSGGGGATGSW
ncbi:TPM domain-containing protein [Gemmatimonadota bacterium]